MRLHYVTFLSPGTFACEETTKPIDSWDVATAVRMARDVRERYGATPFAFYFLIRLTADPVSDGEGGLLAVVGREVERSGTHFLGGTLLTLDDVERAGGRPILSGNMKINGWPVVVDNYNSWRSTQPFEERDVIVSTDEPGAILRRGDEPELVAYRAAKLAERAAAFAKTSPS